MDLNLLKSKSTEELENEIANTEDINQFRTENEAEFVEYNLADYLKYLLEKYQLDRSSVFKRAQMIENNYGYEIFRGSKKNISRDKLIQICFGFPLSLEEAKTVLRLGNVRPLYPRDERDAFIMFALKNGLSLYETDELLYEHSQKTII